MELNEIVRDMLIDCNSCGCRDKDGVLARITFKSTPSGIEAYHAGNNNPFAAKKNGRWRWAAGVDGRDIRAIPLREL